MENFRRKMRERMAPDIKGIFREKCEKLGVEATLDLEILDHQLIVGENVYGQAFPEEKRVELKVYPEATPEGVERAVCDELIHIKWPELKQYDEEGHEREEYRRKIEECMK